MQNAALKTTPHTFTEFTGIEYLLIDIAGNYGLDKKNWDERIDWTLSYEPQLMKMIRMTEEDPSYTSPFLEEADEPAMFYAGVKALEAARQGKPTGYPISLDATASGMQILAIMSGCAKSAAACNVIPSSEFYDNRENAYTLLYDVMKGKVSNPADVSAADSKDSIMTSLYGSTAVPKKYFGTGDMLKAFYDTLEQEIPGAWSLNIGLKNLWQPNALSHDWVLPDNFHVHVKEMNMKRVNAHFLGQPTPIQVKVNQGAKEGLSLCPNVTHS